MLLVAIRYPYLSLTAVQGRPHSLMIYRNSDTFGEAFGVIAHSHDQSQNLLLRFLDGVEAFEDDAARGRG